MKGYPFLQLHVRGLLLQHALKTSHFPPPAGLGLGTGPGAVPLGTASSSIDGPSASTSPIMVMLISGAEENAVTSAVGPEAVVALGGVGGRGVDAEDIGPGALASAVHAVS